MSESPNPAPRRRWYQFSLATRIAVVGNLLLVAAVGLGGLWALRVSTEEIRAGMVDSGEQFVASFGDLNRMELLDDVSGKRNLQLQLVALTERDRGRTLEAAHVYDRDRELFAGVGAQPPMPIPFSELTKVAVLSEEGALTIGAPIFYSKTTLGYVVFRFSQNAIHRATERILERTAAVLAVSMLLNMLVLLVVLRYLLQPLQLLSAAARKFVGGNYGHRVAIARDDEVGDTARSFNAMCDELETHLKFSNAALVDRIRRGEATDEGQEHQLSIVFGDVVSYTRWSQRHAPAEIFATLRRYYRCLGELFVRRFDGVIDKFMGDGIMAHFGLRHRAGAEEYTHVRQALCAGIYAQVALRVVAHALAAQGHEPLTYRFGIASGRCLVGAIGAEDIMLDFSLIGGVVNLASRLEGRAVAGGLVIDRFTHLDAGPGFLDDRDWGRHTFKGFDEAIQVFSVRGFERAEDVKAMQRYLLDELFASPAMEAVLFDAKTDAAARQKIRDELRQEIEERPYLSSPDEPPSAP